MNPDVIEVLAKGPAGWGALMVGAGAMAKLLLPVINSLRNGHSGVTFEAMTKHCQKEQEEIRERFARGDEKFEKIGDKFDKVIETMSATSVKLENTNSRLENTEKLLLSVVAEVKKNHIR